MSLNPFFDLVFPCVLRVLFLNNGSTYRQMMFVTKRGNIPLPTYGADDVNRRDGQTVVQNKTFRTLRSLWTTTMAILVNSSDLNPVTSDFLPKQTVQGTNSSLDDQDSRIDLRSIILGLHFRVNKTGT